MLHCTIDFKSPLDTIAQFSVACIAERLPEVGVGHEPTA